MRRTFLVLLPILFTVACSTPNRFLVTGVGYEPQENNSILIYALPKTGLKIHIDYRKEVFIPGPYADYAQRQLGIEGVRKVRSETWHIDGARIESTTEPDFSRIYSLAGVEGVPDMGIVDWAEQNNLIVRGDYRISTGISTISGQDGQEGLLFTDVTMEPNMEKKEQTVYKTLITDTSFVRVPVTTEQMERKTIERKAEEAARLILEIRSDRYYLSAGLVDPLPADFDMETAMSGLDRLEEEYLSLFIGKSYTEQLSKGYFLLPSGSLEPERYSLELFSEALGIGAPEGTPVELVITPAGDARSLRNLLPQEPEAALYNHFYYRIPETCDVSLSYNAQELARKRISVFQSGALVNEKVHFE
ncbi:MAG: DUF4831 family protein [Bacteroidales bacterium]|nr:DUF4831 family protein [Bacteroidales bacterium]MDT8430518.1 DUF4831 family protein [Bacteroidales bacterium]